MQVSRWGNSLAVRLPKDLVERLGLAAGDALARMQARKVRLPEDYRFDRDAAHDRGVDVADGEPRRLHARAGKRVSEFRHVDPR